MSEETPNALINQHVRVSITGHQFSRNLVGLVVGVSPGVEVYDGKPFQVPTLTLVVSGHNGVEELKVVSLQSQYYTTRVEILEVK